MEIFLFSLSQTSPPAFVTVLFIYQLFLQLQTNIHFVLIIYSDLYSPFYGKCVIE